MSKKDPGGYFRNRHTFLFLSTVYKLDWSTEGLKGNLIFSNKKEEGEEKEEEKFPPTNLHIFRRLCKKASATAEAAQVG